MNVQRERLQTRDGRTIGCLRAGSGVPVVLLHALSANAETNWLDTGVLAHLIERGAEVVAPDLRGHGTSRTDDGHGCDLDSLVADVEDVIGVIGAPCHLVGYSLGALVTAHVAAAQRVDLTSIVLSGIGEATIAFGLQEGGMVDAVVEALLAPDLGAITDPLGQGFRAQVEAWGASPVDAAALLQDLREPHELDLSRITVPTLVLNGESDAPAAEIGERIPGARLGTVPGDHMTAPSDPDYALALGDFIFEGTRTRGTQRDPKALKCPR